MRFAFPAIIGLVIAIPLQAGEDGLTGNWKLSIYEGPEQIPLWIMQMESKDGKIKANLTPLMKAPKVEVIEVKLAGDTFTILMRGEITEEKQKASIKLEFEGKLPKPGAKRILGSLTFQGTTGPAILEATMAKNQFELDRDVVVKTPTDPKAFTIIFQLLKIAADKKVDAKDVTEWVEGSIKAAQQFGPRYAGIHQYRLLDHLVDYPAYSKIAVEIARKNAKAFQADAARPLQPQLDLGTAYLEILQKAEQKDDVKALAPRLEKLEVLAYAEHAKAKLEFNVNKYTRKTKSKRAVLMELFTGAQCPPCVAADMAFDGLEKTYTSRDVVLLQYHVHIPRPDPLNNADTDARYDFYEGAKKIRGTPSSLFNGAPAAPGGGGREDAADKYKEYCDAINKLFELPEVAQIGVTADRTGDKIAIKAEVKDLKAVGGKLKLRLALVEDWARYRGSNGLTYHHRVVRAMPGGARGFTLKGNSSEHTVDVDLEKERKRMNKFLDESYPEGVRPMRLRDLHVVAFIQDDETMDVLNAIDVPVVDKK
jgi:hypothetical protein